jgi:plasminogen activator inhibitor 1 RNA-binding protein
VAAVVRAVDPEDEAASLTSTVRPARRKSKSGAVVQCLTLCSDTQKSINQGWGAEEGTAELKAEEAAIKDASAEAAPAADWAAPADAAADWAAPADGAAPAEGGAKADREGRPPRREREPEEEDNTLTLEQYLAQQKEKDSIVPKLEGVRKANEGADANIWKDVVALEKSEEDAYFVGKVRLLLHRIILSAADAGL